MMGSVFQMKRKESENFNNHLDMFLFYKELLEQKREDPRSVAIPMREIEETKDQIWHELFRIIPTEVHYHMEKDLNEVGVITVRQQYSNSFE